MQYVGGLSNTFRDDTVEKYMTWKIKLWVLENEFADSVKLESLTEKDKKELTFTIRDPKDFEKS